MASAPDRTARIKELEKEIDDLKRRLPAHSIPASMLIHLEELEDELARLERETP